MNILVTGGAGFIGSHLCEALIALGHKVTCVDDFSTGKRENLINLDSLEVVTGDVNDLSTWQALMSRKFDAIYYYAALVGVKRTEENPLGVLKDTLGLYHLAQFAKKMGVKKVIFSSSSEVYGQGLVIPMPENEGYRAWSPYTAVKLYGEHILQSLWQHDGIPTVSLRFFNVYGPRQTGNDYGFVVSKFIEEVLAGQAPPVFGDGKQTRDFVFIADNIRAAIAVLESEAANGEIINVGTGKETSIMELAHTVINVAGANKIIEPILQPARSVEINRRCASIDKMKELLDMECTTQLAFGLQQTIASFAQVKTSPVLTSAIA